MFSSTYRERFASVGFFLYASPVFSTISCFCVHLDIMIGQGFSFLSGEDLVVGPVMTPFPVPGLLGMRFGAPTTNIEECCELGG